MNPALAAAFLGTFVMLLSTAVRAETAHADRVISLSDLEDKIRGGWAGQVIGVSYGGPTEFKAMARTFDWEIAWNPTSVKSAIDQDDLYTEMQFCAVLDKSGLDASAEELGQAFAQYPGSFWHANLVGRRNVIRGILPPLSGSPAYSAHANDIDFQIESDFIGLMCPGLPQAANRFADRVGHIMNYGDGVYGGMFVSGMYSAAFFESSNARAVVESGLACIPAESRYAKVIADTLRWSAEHPDDWKTVWRKLEEKWAQDDPCPGGALKPFNIDASINGAYIAVGLLYGGTDFAKAIEISTRCGQDSDCNPASTGGIVGTMIGYNRIPDLWKQNIKDMGDTKFRFTEYSFEDIVNSTIERAKKVVVREGGRIEADQIIVPVQKPVQHQLEQWEYGRPVRRVAITDPGWSLKGNWEPAPRRVNSRRSNTAGDEAIFEFEGTGVTIGGALVTDGGLADVYLDGKFQSMTDCFLDCARGRAESRGDMDIARAFGLTRGKHLVRVVVKGSKFKGSTNSWVVLTDAVVFDRPPAP